MLYGLFNYVHHLMRSNVGKTFEALSRRISSVRFIADFFSRKLNSFTFFTLQQNQASQLQ